MSNRNNGRSVRAVTQFATKLETDNAVLDAILSGTSTRDTVPGELDELNPDGFNIVIPISGGLDSYTLCVMAERSSLPYIPLVVDIEGIPRSAGEEAAINKLFGSKFDVRRVHLPAPIITTPSGETQIDTWRARNLLIIAAAADHLNGTPGEVWFGNNSGPSETPIANGGDKGFDFLNAAERIIRMTTHNRVRLASPLIGMRKSDQVRYLQFNGRIDKARQTFSCVDAMGVSQCGRCWHCWRNFSAFALSAGVNRQQYPEGVDFSSIPLHLPTHSVSGSVKWTATRLDRMLPLLRHLETYKYRPPLPYPPLFIDV